MEPKILEYEGKKYALVIDNREDECSRCALQEKCNELPEGTLCKDEIGLTDEEGTHHRFEEIATDITLFKVVRALVELGAEFDIKALGLHITTTN